MKIAMDPEAYSSELITQLEHIVNFKRKKFKPSKKDNFNKKKTERNETDKSKEIGGIKYDQIYHYVIDRVSKIHLF